MKHLSKYYIIALSVIAVLAIASSLIMTAAITTQKHDSTIINVSGKQRMLSQRISLLSTHLIYEDKRDVVKKQLKSDVAEMKRAHIALTKGNEDMGIPSTLSDTVYKLYFEDLHDFENLKTKYGPYKNRKETLNDRVFHYLEKAQTLAHLDDSLLTPDNPLLMHVSRDFYDTLLPSLHKVVNQYEKESHDSIQALLYMQAVTLGILLITLILQGQFIFRPMLHRVETYIEEIKTLAESKKQNDKYTALGEMAGGIAHEINNGLQPIIGLGEILKMRLEKQGDEKAAKHLSIMYDSALHVRKIVEGILLFTRKGSREKAFINAGSIRDILEFSSAFLSKGIRFAVNIDNEERLKSFGMWADQTNLRQVFINLFKNASQAMDQKGNIDINVCVRAPDSKALEKLQLKENLYCVIAVQDSGCGMEKDVLDNVFVPLFTTKAEGEGTGLGLAAVYGIIKDHKGTITVDSIVDEGTTFTIYLPLSEDDDQF